MKMDVYHIYEDMISQTHLLVSGQSGSGKSVLIQSLLHTICFDGEKDAQLILIDPKRVDLLDYKDVRHTIKYASDTPQDIVKGLEYAVALMEGRYGEMQRKRQKKYNGSRVYVVIEELADLMTVKETRNKVQPLIQRLCQLGRAANLCVIAATQCPLASVIPTSIAVNFDARVGLRVRNAQDSRNAIGVAGCESLPKHGYGYYYSPDGGLRKVKIPMYEETDLKKMIALRRKGLFARLIA